MSDPFESAVRKDGSAVPFVMEDFGGNGPAPEKEAETVGDDVVEIERQAYEKGFASGEKAGYEMGLEKARVAFQGIDGVLKELNSFGEKLARNCERDVTELALAVARKVVQREIETREETVVDCVRAALDLVVASGRIVVKVNPRDLEVLHDHTSELARGMDGLKGLSVEGDESVSRGGCVLETNYGEVDATIDGIMAEIEEKLRDAG